MIDQLNFPARKIQNRAPQQMALGKEVFLIAHSLARETPGGLSNRSRHEFILLSFSIFAATVTSENHFVEKIPRMRR